MAKCDPAMLTEAQVLVQCFMMAAVISNTDFMCMETVSQPKLYLNH
jgi:hypothetical protein